MTNLEKVPFDLAAYNRRTTTGPCFVCAVVAGDPDHEVLWQDQTHIVFLNRYPTLSGYTLVSPKAHIVDTVTELSLDQYLSLQTLIHKVATAWTTVLPTERTYILSLGSAQANSHVHWHVASLPPGVPHERQQFHALMSEGGVFDQTPQQRAELARRYRPVLRSLLA